MLNKPNQEKSVNEYGLVDEAKIVERHKTSIMNDVSAAIERAEANGNTWHRFSVFTTILMSFIIGVLLLERLGYFSFVPVPSAEEAKANVSIADLLGAFIPALLLIVAFLVGATGLKRLQLYDGEFKSLRSERRADAVALRNELSDEFERIGESLELRAREAARKTTEEALQQKESKLAADFENLLQELLVSKSTSDEIKKSIEKISLELEVKAEKFGWLLKDEGAAKLLEEGAIGSAGELHAKISQFLATGSSETAKRLVESYFSEDASSPSSVRGNANDFFNTAAVLARYDLEPLAWRVCEAGLYFHPKNPDLMSNAVKFALDAVKQTEPRSSTKKLWPSQKYQRTGEFGSFSAITS